MKKIDYGSQLEGIWNYIYFGYKRGPETGEATAIVIFSEGQA